ncbi:MAG TPA: hypothetical protein VHE13_12720 [Opitutus sp.]|nr:hypothetical protein [Opitutus sp.]
MPRKDKVASKCLLVAAAGLAALAAWGCAGGAAAAPAETKEAMKQITIAVTVPDAGWQLRIERVLDCADAVWVLAQLHRKPGPAAQVIRTLEAAVPVAVPDKPVRVFVAGKTWAWPNKEPYEFVASLPQVMRRAGEARVLYPAASAGEHRTEK